MGDIASHRSPSLFFGQVVNGNEFILQRDGYRLTIGGHANAKPLPKSEIERVFATMTFATYDDPRTWFDAAESIPQ